MTRAASCLVTWAGPVALVLALVGCRAGTKTEPDAAKASLDASSSPFAWVPVRGAASAPADEHPARLVRTAESEAVVVAPLPGRIVALLVKPGDAVEKGTAVARISMPELDSAIATVASASASLEVLERRRARLAELEKEQLARDADVAAVDLEIARHRADRARARAVVQVAGNAQGGEVVLVSALAGVVVEVGAILGELRRPEDGAVARVRGRFGQRIEATLPARPARDGAYFFRTGDVDVPVAFVNAAPSPSGIGHLAWFEPGPAVELPSASEGRLRVGALAADDVWVIPASAVGEDGARRFVVARLSVGAVASRVDVEVVRVVSGDAVVRGALTSAALVATDPERAGSAGGAAAP